jgi:hypothetical protein
MFSYENLEVYKKAYALNQAVYRLLKANTSIPRYAKDQLGRASLSIVLNIAEGSAKFSNRDKKNLLPQGHLHLNAPPWSAFYMMKTKFQLTLKLRLLKLMMKFQECFLR